MALDDESEPEPDLSVVQGQGHGTIHSVPARPGRGVTRSDLAYYRLEKGGLHARAGVTDYWIVNLMDRVLEVNREPVADTGAPSGWRCSAARQEVHDRVETYAQGLCSRP